MNVDLQERMNNMELKCIARCTKVNKPSQSPAFVGLKEGYIIEFTTEIKAVGRGNKGASHATYIKCYNPITKKTSLLSFNQIGKTLDNFEFEQE